MRTLIATLTPLAAAALLAACATGPLGPDARTATIQRTANGVPHISAPDAETLAYAMAYAYAQDNVCMTADQLVTVRGERARYFGGATPGLLARRMFPNEQIDLFIAAHMDDAALERAWAGASAESQAMARGAVAGYNRYLADQAGKLPAACNGQPWVKPMTMAEFRRQGELTAVQAATAALADAVLGAKPPAAAKSSASTGGAGEPGRRRRRDARGRPARLATGLQRLGLRQGHHRQRQRPAAGQPALSVGRRQPLLAGAPDHPRQPRRDGRGHRQLPGRDHRLQQGRGLVAHGLHRQALHAARADARRWRPHRLPDRRQAREDDLAHRQRAGARRRRQPADQVGHAVVHPLGPRGSDPARRPELDRQDRLCAKGRQPGQRARRRRRRWASDARATCRRCARP